MLPNPTNQGTFTYNGTELQAPYSLFAPKSEIRMVQNPIGWINLCTKHAISYLVRREKDPSPKLLLCLLVRSLSKIGVSCPSLSSEDSCSKVEQSSEDFRS
ncbi:hypothetical protein NE237_020614 [Protea cynaroides]|uniref:Uncharacterized protein n=1 Tax=Protea cynaroides TaxID=273540 RepID=A0A9Q0H7K0_9MAGN|nr:hypothetical protein NE237_020614 [Protea cynaroides]